MSPRRKYALPKNLYHPKKPNFKNNMKFIINTLKESQKSLFFLFVGLSFFAFFASFENLYARSGGLQNHNKHSYQCAQITVRWKQSESIEKYELYRDGSLVYSGKETQFTDANLVLGQTYAYKIRGTNTSGKGPFSSEVMIHARNVCVPSEPQDVFTAPYPCGGSVLIYWKTIPSANIYEVSRGGSIVYQGPLTYFFDSGLPYKRSNVYMVRAYNTSGWGRETKIRGLSSDKCPPDSAPELVFGGEEVGEEGYFSLSLRDSPGNGTTVGGIRRTIASYEIKAFYSDMVIRRVDLYFDKDPYKYLENIEIRVNSRNRITVPVDRATVEVFSGGREYVVRISGLFFNIPQDKNEILQIRVLRKKQQNLTKKEEIKVYLKSDSIRVEDNLFISHILPGRGGGIDGNYVRSFVVN